MTLLRYSIYCFGGILFCVLYILLGLAVPVFFSPFFEIIFLALSVVGLYAFDRWVHHVLFGRRLRVVMEKYQPCPVCPVTGQDATEHRVLVFNAQGFGPVHASMDFFLPILISRAAAKDYPGDRIGKMPGVYLARFTHDFAVLYLKNENYYRGFIQANEHALK